jgi:hypothetical protein
MRVSHRLSAGPRGAVLAALWALTCLAEETPTATVP